MTEITLSGFIRRYESVSQQNIKRLSEDSCVLFFLLFMYLLSKSIVQTLYFSLRELQAAKGPLGLHIERDMYWIPKTIAQIKAGDN